MSANPHLSEIIAIPKSTLRRGLSLVGALIAVVIVVVLILALVRAVNPPDSLSSAINPREYQAVFLSNGQVYFGKLSVPGGNYYYLRHPYQLTASVQGSNATQQSLVPVRNEIQAPEDEMIVSRSQVLYVENLKPSGRVSRVISASGS